MQYDSLMRLPLPSQARLVRVDNFVYSETSLKSPLWALLAGPDHWWRTRILNSAVQLVYATHHNHTQAYALDENPERMSKGLTWHTPKAASIRVVSTTHDSSSSSSYTVAVGDCVLYLYDFFLLSTFQSLISQTWLDRYWPDLVTSTGWPSHLCRMTRLGSKVT